MPSPKTAKEAFVRSYSSNEHVRLEWKAAYRSEHRNVLSDYKFPLMARGTTYKTFDERSQRRIIIVGTPVGNVVLAEDKDSDNIRCYTDDDLFTEGRIAIRHLLGIHAPLNTPYEVERILGRGNEWPNIGKQILKLFEFSDERKY